MTVMSEEFQRSSQGSCGMGGGCQRLEMEQEMGVREAMRGVGL